MDKDTLDTSKKRKKAPKLYGFHTFADPGCPIPLPSGPFRDNVRHFLQQCAEVEEYNINGMPIWCTLLVHKKGFVIPLYTIEESVKYSAQPFCDQCRCTGWSHHLVSKRKYHVIVPVDEMWYKPLPDGVFDMQSHLLHGLIHCNGFGHLLCINGREGGSKHLCGQEIMDLWDRICTNLRTRKITVEDVSKKMGMDFRLLHGIAYGYSWFGKWGYKFCNGSFGVTKHKYERAIEILSSLELDQIIQDFCSTNQYRDVKRIICCYRDLSEAPLITIRDLLKFMLTLKPQGPLPRKSAPAAIPPNSSSRSLARPVLKEKNVKCRNFSIVAADMGSRWSVKRMEYVAEIVVDALKQKKASANGVHSCGMTRQEVRDAARMHIGDTGLIDYVLKSINNVIVGGYIVSRAVNRSTRVLEYMIREVDNVATLTDLEVDLAPVIVQPVAILSGNDVYTDITYLYANVLLNYPEYSEMLQLAVGAVIDSKHFLKEWPFTDGPDQLLRFICRLMPSFTDMEAEFTRGYPPGEQIVVPLYFTVGDLREIVQNAFRDTYYITEKFLVTSIEGMEEVDEVLFGVAESGSEIFVRGVGIDMDSEFKYEAGLDNWTVKCKCGTKDDDGERMVACDICEVWQHTRCIGINDSEVVPPVFICESCCAALAPPRTIQPSFECEFASFENCCY